MVGMTGKGCDNNEPGKLKEGVLLKDTFLALEFISKKLFSVSLTTSTKAKAA